MPLKLPKIISQEEFELLHSEAMKLETNTKGKRKLRIRQYRLAMILGFEGGMRISEILGYKDRIQPLSKSQIEGNSIRVISGKGGKDRIVPRPKRVNQRAVDMLPLNVGRRAVQHFITNLGKKHLKKHITFHTLRHGFITHCIDRGLKLHEVQMLAGHSRLDTTGIYLHANPQKAIEGARQAF
jgi:integrase/recombinase XerD